MNQKKTTYTGKLLGFILPIACVVIAMLVVMELRTREAAPAGSEAPAASVAESEPAQEPAAPAVPPQGSPMGLRRMFNYNGRRYAFLEEGPAGVPTDEALGEELGVLAGDMAADPQRFAAEDLAASFAVGGSLHRLGGWDPAFRVAVRFEDALYTCQSVARLDGTPLEAAAYFEAAGLGESAGGVKLYDHMGLTEAASLDPEQGEALRAALVRCTPAQLTDEEYQAIGSAQSEGRSWQAAFCLEDGSQLRLYVIPELGVAMLGDGRYRLPEDFAETCGSLFEGLEQGPVPQF